MNMLTGGTLVSTPPRPWADEAAPAPFSRPQQPRPGYVEPVTQRVATAPTPPPSAEPTIRIALNRQPLTFAVDVSGSTSQDRILEEEKAAILAISSTLQPASLSEQSSILPWNSRASAPVALADIGRLWSSGGTNPAALLHDEVTAARLQSSHIWFLMTDGEIDEPYVHSFANGISGRGIHGTAAVVMLFGIPKPSPFDCNVSVGLSVFGVSPHCIFLFHDVKTSRVYVFQAKGCFLDLLPTDRRFVSFGNWTRWEDLVQIRYEDLAQVKIPPAAKIAQETVLLPDGRELDMNAIYGNTLSGADRLDLLGDYPALDVVLLAAKTRGREHEVRAWIINARAAKQAVSAASLEDEVDGVTKLRVLTVFREAASTVPPDLLKQRPEMLWQLFRAHSPSLDAPMASLRYTHASNWNRFHLQSIAQEDFSARVDETVDDVVRVMDLPSRTECDLLFIPGFKDISYGSSNLRNHGTCYICREPSTIRTLLLRRSPTANETDHFPQPGSQSRYKYPMILGNFPETDVLLPITSCDACAVTLLQIGDLPNGEIVARLLPLVPLDHPDHPDHKQMWLSALQGVYLNRFHDEIVLPVFLSSICSTLEDLDANDEQNCGELVESLEWCCRAICDLPDITNAAALTPLMKAMDAAFGSGNPSSDSPKPLKVALREALSTDTPITDAASLLSYPVGGFVMIVRLAGIVTDIKDPRVFELFVWKRLLHHFVEAHHQHQREHLQGKGAVSEGGSSSLRTLLWTTASPFTSPGENAPTETANPTPKTSLSLSEVAGTHLFSDASGVPDQFRRLGGHYAAIETTSKYGCALAVFLHLLDTTPCTQGGGGAGSGGSEAATLGILAALRDRASRMVAAGDGGHDIFLEPTLVDEGEAAGMVAGVYK
ncbi:hypothetical protein C8A01DRAFT_36554 [Parachaetomium inaequale]|uniref:Uncharacterized protein n=1 Tax=Parachaetomium inaequale TaxID=2588326 RepID=A0AAN6PIZ9_9PEZI|nr:hypothetical protein C8A01DRAFT_36554 [Parachaetomium inaequale]